MWIGNHCSKNSCQTFLEKISSEYVFNESDKSDTDFDDNESNIISLLATEQKSKQKTENKQSKKAEDKQSKNKKITQSNENDNTWLNQRKNKLSQDLDNKKNVKLDQNLQTKNSILEDELSRLKK